MTDDDTLRMLERMSPADLAKMLREIEGRDRDPIATPELKTSEQIVPVELQQLESAEGDIRISRRVVLTGTGLALGTVAAAAMVSQATAQEKLSQPEAKYQGMPKGDQRCDGCMLFQPPNMCKVVEGEISPSGWCQLFVKKT